MSDSEVVVSTAVSSGGDERTGHRLDLAGVLAIILLPVLYTQLLAPHILAPRLGDSTVALVGLGFFWLCAGAALALWRTPREGTTGSPTADDPGSGGWWSGLPRPGIRGVILALGLGLALSLLVPLLTSIAQTVFGAARRGGIEEVAAGHAPWLLALSVLTAAVTEEIIFRGYPIEKLAARRGGTLQGALLGFVAFVAVHAGGWNLAHIVGVVLPLGAALVVIYLIRRQLWFVMIVHLMIDLPLVIMSLMAARGA